jgi:hypothetical protein
MLDLYNQIADPNGITIAENPYGAKVVRSFRLSSLTVGEKRKNVVDRERRATTSSSDKDPRSLAATSAGNKGLTMEFVLSGVRPSERLIEAELHLFRTKHMIVEQNSSLAIYQVSRTSGIDKLTRDTSLHD